MRFTRMYYGLAAFALGAVIGAVYYHLSWVDHLPYLGFNWLGRLIGADGERGYDADFYESLIDFGVAVLFLYIGLDFLSKRLRTSR